VANLVVLFRRFRSSTATLVGWLFGGGCLVLGEGGARFSDESFGGRFVVPTTILVLFRCTGDVDYGGGFVAPAIVDYDGVHCSGDSSGRCLG
jgi:hypothetical protein